MVFAVSGLRLSVPEQRGIEQHAKRAEGLDAPCEPEPEKHHVAVPERIAPYDPHGYGRHLHSAHEWTDGKRLPERKSFYEAVAKTLRGAEQVLMFGSGTGRSSAMEQLLADLKDHHPDVAEKVVGSVVVDAHHTTEDQLLARAREFYAEYNRK